MEGNKNDVLLLGASRAATARICDCCDKYILDLHWNQCTKCRLYDLHIAVPGVQAACGSEQVPANRFEEDKHEQDKCAHEMREVSYDPDDTNQKDLEEDWQRYYDKLITTRVELKDDVDANIVLRGVQRDAKKLLHPNGDVREHIGSGDLEKHIEIAALKLMHYTVTPESCKMLCLDGGGVRGYFTILVLQTVIEKMFFKSDDHGQKNNGFLSLDHPQWKFVRHFDVISGTSTGGLIAFCLTVGYSLHELEEMYTKFSYYFERGWLSAITRIPLFYAKYNPDRIDKRIEELITSAWANFGQDKNIDGDKVTLSDYANVRLSDYTLITTQGAKIKGKLPILIITAYNVTKNKVMLFNSDFSGHQHYKLLDVLKATKAAPTYFPSVKIMVPQLVGPPEEQYFVDGGLFANDPSVITLLLQSMAIKNRTYAIVSIGTAAYPKTVNVTSHGGYLSWLLPNPIVNILNWFYKKENKKTDSTGLLVDTFMEANSNLTETFIANMNPFKVLRFKFNCYLPEVMALDDPSFIKKVTPHFRNTESYPCATDITESDDMKCLILFIRRFIEADRPADEPEALRTEFSEFITDIINEKIAFLSARQ